MRLTIRGTDGWGSGAYHAPRGNRRHNGIDIVVKPHQKVHPLCGGKVTKIGFPYDPHDEDKGYLRYVEVRGSNGYLARYFYLLPCVTTTQYVCEQTTLGIAEDVGKIWKEITPHYHFEVLTWINDEKVFLNPIQYLTAIGHEINESR